MALTTPSKLEKLQIYAYQDAKRTQQTGAPPANPFVVPFNPTSVAMTYDHTFQKYQGINTSGHHARYVHSAQRLKMELVLDGTGVTEPRLPGLEPKSVDEQIEAFLDLCYHMDGKLHEPRFLKIQWGGLHDFDCRLASVEITYSTFDKNGLPLRAQLAMVFVEDLDPEKRVRKEGKSSPDLTHTRIVKSGDTLPLLTQAMYGSSVHYLRVAQVNQLDDFRNLTPGQEIFFPPLAP